ncbi:MAG: hypothetical protein AAB466_01565 [Verrucomicrobiota bacterium]
MHFFEATILTGLLLLAGCATSTIQTRKAQNIIAYNAFSPEVWKLVDQGQIKVGMNTNAVFIAWGRPSKILTDESSNRLISTWIYYGSWVESIPYWSYTPNRYGWGTYDHRVLPCARTYVRAEVVFQDDHVIQWRTFPSPADQAR